ncbi:DUF6053 domain-containing protein [Lysobacter enzymogenes]
MGGPSGPKLFAQVAAI